MFRGCALRASPIQRVPRVGRRAPPCASIALGGAPLPFRQPSIQATFSSATLRAQQSAPGEATETPTTTRLPLSVQAIYYKPLHRKPQHCLPVCNLILHSFSVRQLEAQCDFALRAAYYLNMPATGSISLPRKIRRWTVPRSNFVHKKSQENYEQITYKRLIQIMDTNPEVIELWLAFLKKHAVYGVGMKANVWTFEEVGVGKAMNVSLDNLYDVKRPTWAHFGPRKTVQTAAMVRDLLESEKYKVPETQDPDAMGHYATVEQPAVLPEHRSRLKGMPGIRQDMTNEERRFRELELGVAQAHAKDYLNQAVDRQHVAEEKLAETREAQRQRRESERMEPQSIEPQWMESEPERMEPQRAKPGRERMEPQRVKPGRERMEPQSIEPQWMEFEPERMEPQGMEPERMEPQSIEPQWIEFKPERMEPQRAKPGREKMESQRMEPQRMEQSQGMEPQRMQSQRAEPQKMEPQRMEPQRTEPQRAGTQETTTPEIELQIGESKRKRAEVEQQRREVDRIRDLELKKALEAKEAAEAKAAEEQRRTIEFQASLLAQLAAMQAEIASMKAAQAAPPPPEAKPVRAAEASPTEAKKQSEALAAQEVPVPEPFAAEASTPVIKTTAAETTPEQRTQERKLKTAAPAKGTHAGTAPAEAAPAEPAETEAPAPVEAAPVEAAPAETAPVETAPVETAPVETAPVETAPVETAPAETAPVETVPVETAPVEAAPVEVPPAEHAPAEPAPPEAPVTDAVVAGDALEPETSGQLTQPHLLEPLEASAKKATEGTLPTPAAEGLEPVQYETSEATADAPGSVESPELIVEEAGTVGLAEEPVKVDGVLQAQGPTAAEEPVVTIENQEVMEAQPRRLSEQQRPEVPIMKEEAEGLTEILQTPDIPKSQPEMTPPLTGRIDSKKKRRKKP